MEGVNAQQGLRLSIQQPFDGTFDAFPLRFRSDFFRTRPCGLAADVQDIRSCMQQFQSLANRSLRCLRSAAREKGVRRAVDHCHDARLVEFQRARSAVKLINR